MELVFGTVLREEWRIASNLLFRLRERMRREKIEVYFFLARLVM